MARRATSRRPTPRRPVELRVPCARRAATSVAKSANPNAVWVQLWPRVIRLMGTGRARAGREPSSSGPVRSRMADVIDAGAPVAIAAAAGAVVALVAAYVLLPDGSYNLDELVYLNDAEAIRHGRLTYDARGYLPDFRPYLSGVAGDRIVFKYQPLWPAWLAVWELLTGGHRIGLVVAGAVAASPVFVAHIGTALAYLPTAGLAAAALGALLRGVRTGSRWWLAAAGVAFGALFFHRPFDAVVAGA